MCVNACCLPLVYPQMPDPREMQINLTGFLNPKNARVFIQELWELLCSAQDNVGGIPSVFLEQKKEEIKRRQVINVYILKLENNFIRKNHCGLLTWIYPCMSCSHH